MDEISVQAKSTSAESQCFLGTRRLSDQGPQSSPSTEKLSPNKSTRNGSHPLLEWTHRRAVCLLMFYLPVLILPWILTCILSKRPLTAPSYYNQAVGLSNSQLRSISVTVVFIRLLNSLASVATVPVIGALLSQAAVVYSQRTSQEHHLSIRQVFALADRGWTDIQTLWKAARYPRSGISSLFLWLAAALLLMSAIVQPLQQILVSFDDLRVMICYDKGYKSCNENPSSHASEIDYDPEPGDMAFVPQNNVVKRVADDIVSVTESEVHPQMWPELNSYSYAKKYGQDGARQQSFRIYSSDEMPMTYFVSAMPNGTTTGVFRQHSLRFNSSVLCNQAIRSDFPSKCPGVRPFEAALNIPDFLNVSVCVPGEFGVLPWTLTRSRQDITEEMYFDVMVSPSLGFNESDRKNFTLHCQANTTRGFFELGNYRNGYAPGPLLDKWPSMDELTRDFNDMLRFKNNRPPGETEYVPDYPSFGQDHVFWAHGKSLDPYGTDSLNVSGPLMTSAIAIFGNESFFHIAASSNGSSAAAARDEICRQGNIPFARYSYNMFGKMPDYCNKTLDEDSTSSRTLARLMNGWLWYWNDTKNARELLKASIFLASHETLAQTVDETYSQGSRTIYTAPGATIIKPDVSTTGIVIISTLIALQVLGLSYVVWYIGRVPIWTSALDAFAVARIGSNIGLQNLAPIGRADHDLQKLSRMDGLVGTVTDSRNGDGIVGLGLGAPGVVTRDLAKRE